MFWSFAYVKGLESYEYSIIGDSSHFNNEKENHHKDESLPLEIPFNEGELEEENELEETFEKSIKELSRIKIYFINQSSYTQHYKRYKKYNINSGSVRGPPLYLI
jgi:hypothetical protein